MLPPVIMSLPFLWDVLSDLLASIPPVSVQLDESTTPPPTPVLPPVLSDLLAPIPPVSVPLAPPTILPQIPVSHQHPAPTLKHHQSSRHDSMNHTSPVQAMVMPPKHTSNTAQKN